ncbi:hypothetical protein CROQUDRAFT_130288 [Cronartium quercuum f. sp. fusiforme G11]|uniref:Uncharacterized protein n=1 Tax=Cronartium quercuum f. sp. fusiforme G11 TaxID=708437 RepID=A0A9P6NVS9_9BASI|nr:hypothetical protein CROQUDRAFT_130288 [Cronartium quercuum f. sp. fusiforme G11]
MIKLFNLIILFLFHLPNSISLKKVSKVGLQDIQDVDKIVVKDSQSLNSLNPIILYEEWSKTAFGTNGEITQMREEVKNERKYDQVLNNLPKIRKEIEESRKKINAHTRYDKNNFKKEQNILTDTKRLLQEEKQKTFRAYRYLRRIKEHDQLKKKGKTDKDFDMLAIELARKEDPSQFQDSKVKMLYAQEKVLFDQQHALSKQSFLGKIFLELKKMDEELLLRKELLDDEVDELFLARIATKAMNSILRKEEGHLPESPTDKDIFLKKLSDVRHVRNSGLGMDPADWFVLDKHELITWNNVAVQMDDFEKAYVVWKAERKALEKGYLQEGNILNLTQKNWLSRILGQCDSEEEREMAMRGINKTEKNIILESVKEYENLEGIMIKQGKCSTVLFHLNVINMLPNYLDKNFDTLQKMEFENIMIKLNRVYLNLVELFSVLALQNDKQNQNWCKISFDRVIRFLERLGSNQNEVRNPITADLFGPLSFITTEELKEIEKIKSRLTTRISTDELKDVHLKPEDELYMQKMLSYLFYRSQILDPIPKMAEVEARFIIKKLVEIKIKSNLISNISYSHTKSRHPVSLESLSVLINQVLSHFKLNQANFESWNLSSQSKNLLKYLKNENFLHYYTNPK